MAVALTESLRSETDLGDLLLTYFRKRVGLRGVRYRERPARIAMGWESSIYRFQLGGKELPAEYQGPLVVRVNGVGAARLRHEFDVQAHMDRLGYPVPHPLLTEKESRWGGPFIIMEWVPGETLMEFLFRRP